MCRSLPSDRPEFKIVFRSSSSTLPSRQLIFESTYKAKVTLQSLIPTPSRYLAKVQSLEDIELLLKPTSVLVLSKIHLIPLSPPNLLARKTVFLRYVESFVGE